MALGDHRKEDIRAIQKRVQAVADSLGSIANEMEELGCETLAFQSESVLNHKLTPLEDWCYRVKGYAEKQFRKLRRDKAAFELGQKYAAEKKAASASAATEKTAKTAAKRGGRK